MTQSFDDVIKTVVASNIYQQMENSDRIEFISICGDFFRLGEGFEQSVNERLHEDLEECKLVAQSKQAEIDDLRKRIEKTDSLIMSFGYSIDVPLRNSLIDAIRGLEDL